MTNEVNAGIFDVRGRLLKILFTGTKMAGKHTLTWDGRGEDGNDLPTGIYYAQVRTSNWQKTIKLALVR